jgi:hypothetical protein
MNIDDLCGRSLLPDWWCQLQPVWLPALSLKTSIQYMKCEYKECQK